MHEVGVMQSALEIALEQAGRQGASRIDCIALRVGMLSGVVPEALEFAFDVVARGTIAEGGGSSWNACRSSASARAARPNSGRTT